MNFELNFKPFGFVYISFIWNYCKNNHESKVGYIHSKGSFHENPDNEVLRPFLTRGVFSDECASLPAECNVCSSHFSTLPHMHTPGNMWLGRCSYISKLLEPLEFQQKMDSLIKRYKIGQTESSVGAGRWAFEHWIHSHPDVKPCDLYDGRGSMAGYQHLETSRTWPIDLQLAPRKDVEFFMKGHYQPRKNLIGWGLDISSHIAEWNFIYGSIPKPDSWIWGHFDTERTRLLKHQFKMSWLNSKDLQELRSLYPNITIVP